MSKVGQVRKLNLRGPHTEVIMFNNNEAGDVVTDELHLELMDECEVTAIGYGLKSSIGVPLKFINMGALGIAEEVRDPGAYMLMTTAYEKVELHFAAAESSEGSITCRALIKTVYGG